MLFSASYSVWPLMQERMKRKGIYDLIVYGRMNNGLLLFSDLSLSKVEVCEW